MAILFSRNIYIGLLIIICSALPAYAQIVNVQPLLKTKGDGFSLHVKSAFEWTTGNTDLLKLDMAIAARYVSGDHLWLAIVDGGYAENSGARFISKSFEHLRYRYRLLNWLGAESFAQYQYDEFLRIDLRLLGGVGARFVPYSNDIIEVSYGTAYMYELDRNKAGSFPDSSQQNYYNRWSNYLNVDITLANNITFFSTFYIQPDILKFSNFRLLNDNSITIEVNKWLSFLIHGVISYDSVPLYAVKPLNTALFCSLRVNLEPTSEKK